MASFSQFLDSLDPQIKGKQFEVFVKWFLKHDPEWSTQVDQIWLWDEYPERWGPDCGIDLVFKHKNSDVWAVQAKCYSPEYSITKSDVDTFLSESNRTSINKRLLIASTDLIGTNAKRTCDNQEKDVIQFLFSDFEKAEIEYPEKFSELDKAKRKDRPKPRPHQSEAVDAVEKGFEENDRGQLIMACGTGKTYTTLWIKERLNSQSTLVLVPSLSLLSQTLREWTFASNESFDVLCVCSDETVGKKSGYDTLVQSVNDLSFPVTSDAEEISHFLKAKGSKVIFSTYHSSPLIAESQSNNKVPVFELVISDEAHRCTGAVGSSFTTVLDETLIKAKRRLFTTATPKTYTANLKKNAEERGVEITGMDDEVVFGKVFYSLPFGEAIKQKLLTDYQVVIVGVDKPMISEWIEKRELLKTSSGEITDAESLASQIGLIKAIKDYDLKRIISFHSRVKRAESFASETQNSILNITKKHIPKGKICADFVSGTMSSHHRRLKLDLLKNLSQVDRGLLSNARCLSEGVDVPALDGVAFIDPKGSQIDIVQAVGRAIRLSQEKKVGTIFLPVFLQEGDDAELSIQSSNFKPVWSVLNALKSHDDVLSAELDQLRTNLGRKKFQGKIKSIPKVIIDFPQSVDESIAESLKTILVERTTESWNFWFGLLEDYVEKERHTLIPIRYETQDGYRLGLWVSAQRQKRKNYKITGKQISKLDSIGFDWDPLNSIWEEGFNYLGMFVKNEGHALVSARHINSDGFRLGQWVNDQREREGKLSFERKSRLNSIHGWTWDVLTFKWEKGFLHLNKYVETEAHTKVPTKYKSSDGFRLGSWVHNQRRSKDQLTPKKILRLDKLGFIWDPIEYQWEEGFLYLKKFVKQNGHTRVNLKYKLQSGYRLGRWVQRQRLNESLTPDKISKLEGLGFDFDRYKSKWEEGFSHLENYVEVEGNSKVPKRFKSPDGYFLGSWVNTQRRSKQTLTHKKVSKLNSVGFDWDPNQTDWEDNFSHLKKYFEANGHSRVPRSYKTEEGFLLGNWVSSQRVKKDSLTKEKIGRLNDIGFVWLAR
jgi:superfamily II DNA or RNA helicase